AAGTRVATLCTGNFLLPSRPYYVITSGDSSTSPTDQAFCENPGTLSTISQGEAAHGNKAWQSLQGAAARTGIDRQARPQGLASGVAPAQVGAGRRRPAHGAGQCLQHRRAHLPGPAG